MSTNFILSGKMDKVVRFKKLSENATTPVRGGGSPYSAGRLDLFSAERKIIGFCDRASRIRTDIVPSNFLPEEHTDV